MEKNASFKKKSYTTKQTFKILSFNPETYDWPF